MTAGSLKFQRLRLKEDFDIIVALKGGKMFIKALSGECQLKALWALLILFSVPQLANASGYRPFFDKAIEEAELIIFGKVIDAWYPKDKKTGSEVDRGRVYRITVKESYKGATKPGEEIIFYDPHHLSTASYFVDEGGANLTFLVPADLSEHKKKRFDFGSKKLYEPIRNFSSRGTDFNTEELDGWLYLVNLVLRNPPKDKKKAYRQILETESNRYILRYVIEHWPEKMTEDDKLLFRKIILKYSDDAYITSPAIERLSSHKQILKKEELVHLLKHGTPYQREELLQMVNSSNINSCQDIIFSWLMEKEPEAEQEAIEVLAKLCPDYLKKQLRKKELPFWVLIPCLQELGINGSDVGKKDINPDVLALTPYTIRDAGEVFRGEEFEGICAMEEPEEHKDWFTACSLLEPLLKGPDNSTRRLVVGLMRTCGLEVKREDPNFYVVNRRKKVLSPVKLKLVAHKRTWRLDKPINLTVKEVGLTDGVWFCFKGELVCTVESEESSTSEGDFFGVWDEVDLPRDAFVRLKKGQIVRSSQDISSLIDEPGKYKVTVKKVYPHDGGSVGVDSWTGVTFSNSVEIEVLEQKSVNPAVVK